jgi:hypothetical protein
MRAAGARLLPRTLTAALITLCKSAAVHLPSPQAPGSWENVALRVHLRLHTRYLTH